MRLSRSSGIHANLMPLLPANRLTRRQQHAAQAYVILPQKAPGTHASSRATKKQTAGPAACTHPQSLFFLSSCFLLASLLPSFFLPSSLFLSPPFLGSSSSFKSSGSSGPPD